MRILVEPKNALLRQFQRLFQIDGVELQFTDDAMRTVAERAMTTNVGARGLRTILEGTLLDVMFEIPSRSDIRKCVIRAETIRGDAPPLLLTKMESSAQADRDEPAESTSESA
jgi:ATP-dependent Clp protease ATP-binding subunit ClpX